MRVIRSLPAMALLVLLAGCAATPEPAATVNPYEPKPYVQLEHPAWSRDAVIYQLNTRQFSPEGTFNAAREQLPRIKALGADIIWLMPIHPIGEKNRKGTLGSPYSVKDFRAVNPEFGTLEDFRAFVDAAHDLGLYVIIDWVANHTAWDNHLATEHPDWYERDWAGNFRPTPWWDWSDIIDLDFSEPGVREYMTEALKYWVAEVGIDGFRCDVAGYVPLDFWENVRAELDAIKPVFMLAEWETRDVHARAFDASYAWSWKNAMQGIAAGESDVGALFGYYSGNESAWPMDAYRMMYIANHDQNSWDGTMFEIYGDVLEPAIVLSVTGEGIPLIYNGQEAGNEKRLEFFEKDPIEWREHPIGELYRQLFALKKANQALWNGSAGARMVQVVNSAPSQVFSFVREKDGNAVFVVLNFSAEPQRVQFTDGPYAGAWTGYFSTASLTANADTTLELAPWSYRVFTR
ncbi:MAG: alpha-amylase family glycosyl hydrolase [Pseudomonadota bacterium]